MAQFAARLFVIIFLLVYLALFLALIGWNVRKWYRTSASHGGLHRLAERLAQLFSFHRPRDAR
jgi:hypothetical protein